MITRTFFRNNLQNFLIIFLSIVLLSVIRISAQINNPGDIEVKVLNTTPSSTTLEFILNFYESHNLEINGSEYIDYNIPGSIRLMQKGFPQLPTHRVSIIIPDLTGMNFRITLEV